MRICTLRHAKTLDIRLFPTGKIKKYGSYCIIASVQMWLRGKDLNQRPPGYEPDELPAALPRDMKFCSQLSLIRLPQLPIDVKRENRKVLGPEKEWNPF